MSLLFADSFDHYATADILKKWTWITAAGGAGGASSSGVEVITGGRHSSSCLRSFNDYSGSYQNGSGVRRRVTTSSATWIAGMAFKVPTAFSELANGSGQYFNFITQVEAAGVIHVYFRLTPTGYIEARKGVDDSLMGTSSLGLVQNNWHYLEFKVVIHDSTGTVTVKLDGLEVLALTGQDTKNGSATSWDACALGQYYGKGNFQYDDVYFCDGAGSYNNDFLGDVRVDAVFPNAAGTTSNWTRSTGADQWATIDEAALNNDTDYNSTTTVNNKDTLNFPAAPVTDAAIKAVQLCVVARKEDGGNVAIKPVCRNGGADQLGAEQYVPSSYFGLVQPYDRQPSDGTTAWDATAFGAAEFGYQKTV